MSAVNGSVEITAVYDLYFRGLFVQAYRAAEPLGPISNWRGPVLRVLAGRLAMHLGAQRLGQSFHIRVGREHPDDAEARYYHARALIHSRGWLPAWRYIEACGDPPAGDDEKSVQLWADWQSMRGYIAAMFRDFTTADLAWQAAQERTPDRPWLWVERSGVLELSDRTDEALEHADRALTLRPWYVPAVHSKANLLQATGRDDEALAFMAEAMSQIESAVLMAQMARLQIELQRYDDANQSLDRMVELAVLREKAWDEWVDGNRSSTAYFVGDYAKAIELGRRVEGDAYKSFIDRLEKLDDPADQVKRVQLPVPYVRQDHNTCVPATLTSLSQFWNRPAEHTEVAEKICFDGTSAYSERTWAQDSGWTAREFRVTWETAVALLDRGVPFGLTTVQSANGHAQAIMGYDTVRHSFMSRDPSQRHMVEFMADSLIEKQEPWGPRGMVMLPPEEAHRIDGVELSDTELYDLAYRVQDALDKHRRADAEDACAAMESAAPDHQLTLRALMSLSRYDSDQLRTLKLVDRLLERYPDDINMELAKLGCMGSHARRDERLALLEEVVARKDADPMLWMALARELSTDARSHRRALRLLRRVHRYRPDNPAPLTAMASIAWDTPDQRGWALQLFEFASCMEDRSDSHVSSYFIAARSLGRTEEALGVLADRFERFGHKSSAPARTLYLARVTLGQTGKGLAVLEEGLRKRPDDGELLTYAAEEYARIGENQRAVALLKQAKPRTPPTDWRRALANVAALHGDRRGALRQWRRILEVDPLDAGVLHAAAQVVSETDGKEAGLAMVRESVDRFPHNADICQLWVAWLHGEEPSRQVEAVQRLLRIDPDLAWARRELAIIYSKSGEHDKALLELQRAHELDPHDSAHHHTLSEVLTRSGDVAGAKRALRKTLAMNVDKEGAIADLLLLCESPAERREALEFVREQLVGQVILGDTPLRFRDAAATVLEPEQLLEDLRAMLAARKDLVPAWSAVTKQLLATQQHDAALANAIEAAERFPLEPQLWQDVASARRHKGDADGEIDALQRALTLNRDDGANHRTLAAAHERKGDLAEATRCLERGLERLPTDVLLRSFYAQRLWDSGDREDALGQIRKVLEIEPRFDDAWDVWRQWSTQLDQMEEAVAFARQTAEQRGTPNAWLGLAGLLIKSDPQASQEAVERAIALEPRSLMAHEFKAILLTLAGQLDEAMAACHTPGWSQQPPELRLREARIETQRGRHEHAIRMVEQVVADDPNFYEGWQLLADWYIATSRLDDFERAADQLVRIAPNTAAPLVYLGEAMRRAKRFKEARSAFRRALRIEPDNIHAATSLAELYMDDQRYDKASAILTDVRRRAPLDPHAVSCQVQLAVALEDFSNALSCFRVLCGDPHAEGEPINRAYEQLRESKVSEAMSFILEETIEKDKINPDLGALWVYDGAFRQQSLHGAPKRLARCFRHDEVGDRAAQTFLSLVLETHSFRELRIVMDQHEHRLRRNVATWGAVGQALAEIPDHAGAVQWLSDWESRNDVEPWALLQLSVSLRELGQTDEAYRVIWIGLQLPPDGSTESLRFWAAVDLAIDGDADAAIEQLSYIDFDSLDDLYKCLFCLADAMVAIRRARGEPAGFRHAKQALQETATKYPWLFKLRQTHWVYQHATERISQDAGGVGAAIWKRFAKRRKA